MLQSRNKSPDAKPPAPKKSAEPKTPGKKKKDSIFAVANKNKSSKDSNVYNSQNSAATASFGKKEDPYATNQSAASA